MQKVISLSVSAAGNAVENKSYWPARAAASEPRVILKPGNQLLSGAASSSTIF